MTTFFIEAGTDDDVRRVAEFDSRDEAIACLRRLIDALLIASHRPGMRPRELLARYQAIGESYAIFQDDDATMNVSGFNPLQHARQRCQEYCGKKDQ